MTSHNEDIRAFAEPADEESWLGTNTDMKIRPSHNEAQKKNEEIVEETFDEYVNYWSGSPKGKTHRVGLTKQELAFVLTLKDEAHKKEIAKAYEAYPYKSPELDAFIESLTPTKEVTEELLEKGQEKAISKTILVCPIHAHTHYCAFKILGDSHFKCTCQCTCLKDKLN